jgi:hypothetical protein
VAAQQHLERRLVVLVDESAQQLLIGASMQLRIVDQAAKYPDNGGMAGAWHEITSGEGIRTLSISPSRGEVSLLILVVVDDVVTNSTILDH